MSADTILGPPAERGRYYFVCRTCATDAYYGRDPDGPMARAQGFRPHELLTGSRRFANLCEHEHADLGHDAEVRRVR